MVWKKIWHNEIYEASDNKLIRNGLTGKILNQRIKKSKYKYVKLCTKYRGKKEFLSHRVIAMAFCKGYNRNKVVNHKDYDRLNNIPSNLEWITRKQNEKHKHNKQYLNY